MLIKNIKQLLQCREEKEPSILKGKAISQLPIIENAWIQLKADRIQAFGAMKDCPQAAGEEVIDARGKLVLPTWIDSHTHLVFADSREDEFVMRLKGKKYQEIAAAGGGILNSAKKLQAMDEEELYEMALKRLHQLIQLGSGAIEIKSGYGLTVDAELKMLRIIQRLKKNSPIPVKATFLGAHAFPHEYKEQHQAYIDLIIHEMLPEIAKEGLADYIDVFCEKVAFSAKETEQILKAGIAHGLKAKVHTNQFNSMGGIETCLKYDALSVDHLEVLNDTEIDLLQTSKTIATLLPSAPFFLSDPYQPARKLIDRHLAVALASDFNPGSSPSGNMNLVVALACIKLKMTPEEAINAATLNAAHALELQDEMGSIGIGKKANLIISKEIPSYNYLPYAFGSNLIDQVIINGKPINAHGNSTN